MSNLTMDKIHAMMAELKALPPCPPPMMVYPSDFWPRDYVADAVYPYRWHPFWQWLARILGRPSPLTMERGHRIYEDQPMVMNQKTGAVFCSRRQANQLKVAIAAQK